MSRRRHCFSSEIEAALDALDRSPARVSASSWPASLGELDVAGLYSWWVDADGAVDLGGGLRLSMTAGPIYAGQTGATKWPSGKVGAMTLRQRIGSNHLSGTIYGSTFRLTVAACLRKSLDLELAQPGRLTSQGEQAVSAWMREHLQVAVCQFANRDALGDLEDEVLACLDPPLNLEGMPSTPLRTRLSALRKELRGLAPDGTSARFRAKSCTRATRLRPSATSPPTTSERDSSVTLHEEIADILREAGNRWMTTAELADLVNARGRYRKRDGSPMTPFQVHGRTRNYNHLFARDGSRVKLNAPV